MSRFSIAGLVALIMIGTVSVSFAASSVIGVVVANGSFQLDRSRAWSNATLFDGSQIETSDWAAQLRLSNGADVRLGADSRAQVYASRLVLEKGIGQLGSEKFQVEAAGLRVATEGAGSVARIQMSGPKQVHVAAYQGSVSVRNGDGVLLAKLDTGRELTFEQQASGASAATNVTGCLLRTGGKLMVTDETTHVTVQVEGAGLEQEIGNRVEITGSAEAGAASAAGAPQVIQVISVKRMAKGGCASNARAGAGGGISAAAKSAIIGGVAVAGAVGGLAAAGALPGQGKATVSK